MWNTDVWCFVDIKYTSWKGWFDMDSEKLKAYTARITQANRSELVVITFDLIIESIEEAKKSLEAADYIIYEKELKRVQKLLNELMGSLDHRFPIAKDLFQLYSFANRRVVIALFKRKPELLDNVISIMEKLRVGFEGVAKEDTSGPVMGNTQKLYAGLTYGKHALDEVFVNVNEATRGFKA